jgi:hypothetical protein
VNDDFLEQILGDYDASRRPGSDPELEAVRAAILFEDVFGVTLSDAEIDAAALAGGSALAALAARRRGPA